MQHLSARDFYTPTPFNLDTKNQIWLSQIADSHDNFCNCNHPFAHLLASIFPPGHKDRILTINQILKRDYKEKCRSGGDADESHGGDVGHIKQEGTEEEEKDSLADAGVEELLAAAEDATPR